MASWIADLVVSLLADSDWMEVRREQAVSSRLVSWLLVQFSPEWVVFFMCIGMIWCTCFVAGSAFQASVNTIRLLGRLLCCRRRGPRGATLTTPRNEVGGLCGRSPTTVRQELVALTGTAVPTIAAPVISEPSPVPPTTTPPLAIQYLNTQPSRRARARQNQH